MWRLYVERRLDLHQFSEVTLDEVEDANEVLDAWYAVGGGSGSS